MNARIASVAAASLGARPRRSLAARILSHRPPFCACANTARTHAKSPLAHALCSAFSPSASLASASLPARSSASHASTRPPAHALCSAVPRPARVRASHVAPALDAHLDARRAPSTRGVMQRRVPRRVRRRPVLARARRSSLERLAQRLARRRAPPRRTPSARTRVRPASAPSTTAARSTRTPSRVAPSRRACGAATDRPTDRPTEGLASAYSEACSHTAFTLRHLECVCDVSVVYEHIASAE